MKNRVVLVLGTFNPLTMAHVELGRSAKIVVPDADIIYVPAGDNYLREYKGYSDDDIYPVGDRVSLLNSVVCRYGFKWSDIEVTGVVDGRTYNTVDKFSIYYNEIYLCLGADQVFDFKRWYRWQDLLNMCTFILFEREDKNCDYVLKKANELGMLVEKVVKMEKGYLDVSSTRVRHLCKNYPEDVHLLKDDLPEEVYEYILRKVGGL